MKRTFLFFLVYCCASAFSWAQYYKVYTTTANGRSLLKTETKRIGNNQGNLVILKPSTEYQTMQGFGYALTYSSCYNLMQMRSRDRKALLRRTFSREVGYGCSYVRISLGCSDFSSKVYSLCDKKGIENFALTTDETDYVIPILQEVLEINPDLKIIASPWTCPRWMKVNNLTQLQSHDSWTGGHLNPSYYADYAQYFVRFVKAFQEQGIRIHAVTPQNEPLHGGNCASLLMPWEEEAAFLNYLAPAFSKAGIDTRIYLFDHNYNYDNVSGQTDYPINIYNSLGKDMLGAELIVGSAWHDYGGSPTELGDIHDKAPDKDIIFTETSIGEWNDGRNLSARLVRDTENLILSTVNRYCSAVIVWNFMLDMKKGPNLDGGCTTCYGAVDIDESDYHTITPNSHFYLINHASAVVQPGAVRIASSSNSTFSGLAYSCFKNPDGTYGVLLVNSGTSSHSITLGVSGIGYAPVSIPSASVVSVLLSAENPSATLSFAGKQMAYRGEGLYSLSVDLVQGEKYATDFLSENLSDWYVDPDFFAVDEQGNVTLKGQSASYLIKADVHQRSLTANPTLPSLDATAQGGLYLVGPGSSVGKPFYTGGTEPLLEQALPLAEVKDKVYQITFTVGEQLNPDYVDFAFYGSDAAWEPKFLGSEGSPYYLTSSSSYFRVGYGRLGHEDGHIYIPSPLRLKEGDTHTLTIDLSQGVSAAILTTEKKDPTGITTIKHEPLGQVVYNLQGQRVMAPQRPGIYILNGKKVLMR